jgi:alkanesulfonate monooxygenase SsuD/methylene tetrahydromethanopterin reductase-like flavin-dependent oxidoreductase (luciferase family)
MAATADRMSGGRLEVGLGAGWVESEHRRNGMAFPPVAVRSAMLDEAATLVRRLWTGEPVKFAGQHFAVDGAQVLPTPAQRPHPPIILGGQGRPRGLAPAAAHPTSTTTSRSPPPPSRTDSRSSAQHAHGPGATRRRSPSR